MGMSARWSDKVKVSFLSGPTPTGGTHVDMFNKFRVHLSLVHVPISPSSIYFSEASIECTLASRPTDDPH